MTDATTPFHDLEQYIALPRVEGIVLSPDGTRAVLTVATLDADRTAYRRALWSVSTDGSGAPARLTRSAEGEGGAAFTRDGGVVFASKRPDAGSDDEAAQLWLLPAAGGEARALTRIAGGVDGAAAVAAEADAVAITAGLLPSSGGVEADAAARAERSKRKVAAILHETYPVRYWDHDLGPDEPHVLLLDPTRADEPAPAEPATGADAEAAKPYPAHLPPLTDLVPSPARSLDHADVALTPDGRTAVVAVRVPEGRSTHGALVAIDTTTGERTTLVEEAGVDVVAPTTSPDGRMLAWLREEHASPAGPTPTEVWVAALDGSDARRVAADWDRAPASLAFDADGGALVVTADDGGRAPVFRILLDDGAVVRVTPEDDPHAYASLAVDRTGAGYVALRSSWAVPPHPVRISLDGTVTPLATPAPAPAAAGTLTEIETTATDGARIRAWLLTPAGADAEHPAPLALWIHGGPISSWNAWSWRWCPQLAAARGWAVLLPDPGLSTGYGLDFVARGWNAWGAEPFTDLMAITDAALSRDDVDASRTAAMGGSFGGYMANWVAGHTDRFDAIVTHASLWALDQFSGTTDGADYWQQIFDEEGMRENSPHRAVADIRTPMLVIHGDRDYRVPIGEGIRLWTDLAEHAMAADGSTPHRFLYFPDENHWVLTPQHAIVWYDTVFAFLDEKVLGRPPRRPANLG